MVFYPLAPGPRWCNLFSSLIFNLGIRKPPNLRITFFTDQPLGKVNFDILFVDTCDNQNGISNLAYQTSYFFPFYLEE
ncbi:hypothetical protein HanIR_Chr04g0174551 [Helianthus annuus]|nr:hypothetical protein HanIR_Chr04g0174551 [Helianthus annuus]